jgi:hypothetical protein
MIAGTFRPFAKSSLAICRTVSGARAADRGPRFELKASQLPSAGRCDGHLQRKKVPQLTPSPRAAILCVES